MNHTKETDDTAEQYSHETNTRGKRRDLSRLFMSPSTPTSDRTDIRVHERHHSWREVYDLLDADLPNDETIARRSGR